jgi:nicotinate-nucleotide--dimethylbenzimidazole phosphoribosyltransferase
MVDSDAVGLLRDAPGPDEKARAAVAKRAAEVLRPSGALARLDEVATWLASWQRTERPRVTRPVAIVFAGDHGVVSEGVNAYPQETTIAMVRAFEAGVATANVLAKEAGAEIDVVDVGAGRPTGNIVREPALSDERYAAAFEIGRAAVARSGADLLVFGEMGIGNSTVAAALCATLYGLPAEEWVGRGSGVDDDGLARKVTAVEAARARVGSCGPMEALRQVGGSELVAIAGATVEARRRSIPVVLDGFIATAAVAPLDSAAPGSLDHCIAGHRSLEPGHRLLLEKLGKEPLLDLGLRLGEGSGALAAIPLIRMAAAAVTDVATFSEWGL